MAADTKTYRGITRTAFDALRSELGRAKVELPPGDRGELSSHGLSGSFAFDQRAQTLTLSMLKYPMLAPRSMVWKAIDDAIGRARG